VLAPTLSRSPLLVKPPTWSLSHQEHDNSGDVVEIKRGYTPGTTSSKRIIEDRQRSEKRNAVKKVDSNRNKTSLIQAKAVLVNDERHAIWKAAETFLGRPIRINDVAHSIIPITSNTSSNLKKRTLDSKFKDPSGLQPMLRVSLIVCGPNEEPVEYPYDDIDFPNICEGEENLRSNGSLPENLSKESSSASLSLVRMVNNIPLLDSSEALACGLVQGLLSKKSLWNAVGLEINVMAPDSLEVTDTCRTPTFEVTDSDQVAPFFKQGVHKVLQTDYLAIEDSVSSSIGTYSRDRDVALTEAPMLASVTSPVGMSLKRQPKLLPASLRLGSILLVIQINSRPSTLPLPTLSKVR
jgi:hypothetical protein